MIYTTLVATCILLQSVTAAPQALVPEKNAELSLAEAKLEAVRSIVNGDGKEDPVSKMTELLAAAKVRAPAAPASARARTCQALSPAACAAAEQRYPHGRQPRAGR